MCFPISLTMADVWRANSRVGMRIKTVVQQSTSVGQGGIEKPRTRTHFDQKNERIHLQQKNFKRKTS